MKLIRIPLKNAVELTLKNKVVYQYKLKASESVLNFSEKQLKKLVENRLKKLGLEF